MAVFSVEPVNRTVREGEEVQLLCAAYGYPRPVLHWQKNGLDIPHHSKGLERLILRIEHFNRSDVGRFRCKAKQLGVVRYSREATVSSMRGFILLLLITMTEVWLTQLVRSLPSDHKIPSSIPGSAEI